MNNVKAKLISDPEFAAQFLGYLKCNVIYSHFSNHVMRKLKDTQVAARSLRGKWKLRNIDYKEIFFSFKNLT